MNAIRITTFEFMKANMEKEKRSPRSYKTTEDVYLDAMKYASTIDTTLAVLVEKFVTKCAREYRINTAIKKKLKANKRIS